MNFQKNNFEINSIIIFKNICTFIFWFFKKPFTVIKAVSILYADRQWRFPSVFKYKFEVFHLSDIEIVPFDPN